MGFRWEFSLAPEFYGGLFLIMAGTCCMVFTLKYGTYGFGYHFPIVLLAGLQIAWPSLLFQD